MERGARALHARLFFVKNPFLEAELRSVAQATGAGGEPEVQAVRSLPAAVCARCGSVWRRCRWRLVAMERAPHALSIRFLSIPNLRLRAEPRCFPQAAAEEAPAQNSPVRCRTALLSAPTAALFGAAAAGAWSRWKERLTRFRSVFYSSPTSAYELSHGVSRRRERRRIRHRSHRCVCTAAQSAQYSRCCRCPRRLFSTCIASARARRVDPCRIRAQRVCSR